MKVSLKKTRAACRYSKTFAAYNVFVEGTKVGRLIPRSPSHGCSSYHVFCTNEGKIYPTVSTRGPYRETLDRYAIEVYNEIIAY